MVRDFFDLFLISSSSDGIFESGFVEYLVVINLILVINKLGLLVFCGLFVLVVVWLLVWLLMEEFVKMEK